MSILKLKDSKGNWIDIPALIGPSGPEGPQGKTGKGIPEGGKPGQILVKGEGNTTRWADAPSTKIWQGPYEEYMANKEAIDQEYVIILTDDPIIESTTFTCESFPVLVPEGSEGVTFVTSDEKVQCSFIQEETVIENNIFKTTQVIRNISDETMTLTGYRVYFCDEGGNNKLITLDTRGANISIAPGSQCSYYHHGDAMSDWANSYIIVEFDFKKGGKV
jgi:hypothetical protein